MKYEVEIPMPPSTNHLYANRRRGRHRTPKYTAWMEEAIWTIKAAIPILEPPIKIGITIYGGKGFSIQSDVSNRMKAPEDALVKSGRLEDDTVQFVHECRQRYFVPQGTDDVARCVLTIVDQRDPSPPLDNPITRES